MSWLAHVGLALVAGISALARSEDATKIGGKSASDWVVALKSDDPKARADASLALKLFGPAARGGVPALVDALDDPRRDVQSGAVGALREIVPDAAAAAPALAGGPMASRDGISARSSGTYSGWPLSLLKMKNFGSKTTCSRKSSIRWKI